MNPYDDRFNSEHLGRGPSSFRHNLLSDFYHLVDAIAERRYQEGFLPMVTLDDCIRYYREESAKLQGINAAGFILSVKKNLDPRNENDNYIVVQGLVDERNKPVMAGGESVSRILHTKTIDNALIKVLNGGESCIFHI